MKAIKREIKFRAWHSEKNEMIHIDGLCYFFADDSPVSGYGRSDPPDNIKLMQFTGLYDKNGKEIYGGDVVRFADKWEWYKTKYGIKMHFADGERFAELQKQYDAEPFEERVISLPDSYSWLLDNDEISRYWEVIGNIYENPELLK